MGADNLINFHKWEKWNNIFKDISIVVFKRHGYNNKALKSMALKKFLQYQINMNPTDKINFKLLPSWAWANNIEIKISSTEIRNQRKLLRGSY